MALALPKTQEEYNEAVDALTADVTLFSNGIKKDLVFIPDNNLPTSATDGLSIYENISTNSVARNEADLHRLLKHEYAHILFQSNDATVDLVQQKSPKIARELIHKIYNIIEDYRIEENWSQAFPADSPDFVRLKKILAANGAKSIKDVNKEPKTPASALFAARVGDIGMLQGAPKEILEMYPEYVKQLESLRGKSYLASYPVLRDIVKGMEKWLEKESKELYKQQKMQEEMAKQLGKALSKQMKGKQGQGQGQQGQQQGQQGQQGGQQGNQQGQSQSGGQQGQPQAGGGAGGTPIDWDKLSKAEKEKIMDSVAKSIVDEITTIDAKGRSENQINPPNPSSSSEQANLKQKVDGKSDADIGKEAAAEGKTEANSAKTVMSQVPDQNSYEGQQTLQSIYEKQVLDESKGLEDKKITEIASPQQASGALRRSFQITRQMQEILHKSQKTNVKRGMRLNYPNLIRKVINPEKSIDIFNKRQRASGGEYWFLLDISGSMQGQNLDALKEVMLTIHDSIANIDKNITFRIFAYNDAGIAEVNREELVKAGADNGTPTAEALSKVYEKMKKNPSKNTERTLFLITDGQPNSSKVTPNTILKFLKRKGIQVFTILIGGAANKETEKKFKNSMGTYIVKDTLSARPLLERIIIRDISQRLRV